MSILAQILSILKEEKKEYTYYIPSLWLNNLNNENCKINPSKLYSEIIDNILQNKNNNVDYADAALRNKSFLKLTRKDINFLEIGV